jgi:hypothetical protein
MCIDKILKSFKNKKLELDIEEFLVGLCTIDDLQLYYIGDYEDKIAKLITHIIKLIDNVEFYNLRSYAYYEDIIRDQVSILDSYKLIEFIKACDENKYVLIDYEASDYIIRSDNIIDVIFYLIDIDIFSCFCHDSIFDYFLNFLIDLDFIDLSNF